MKHAVRSFGFWLVTLLWWEGVMHWLAWGSLTRFGSAVLFCGAAAAIAACLSSLPGRAGKVLFPVLLGLLYLVFAVQLVYFMVFGSFLSLAFVSMGGEAIGNFQDMVVGAIVRSLPYLALLALPIVAVVLVRLRRRGQHEVKRAVRGAAALAGAAVVLAAGAVLTLPLYGAGTTAPATLWSNTAATTDQWAERFGLLTAQALDLRRLVFGTGGLQTADGLDLTAGGAADAARNLQDGVDFAKLDTLVDDKSIQALDAYFETLAGTNQNEYTGAFKGYNLIVVCAEAFSPYLIDEELTPTLYKLSHEGFVFENFYNSFPNLTTNGEYSLCMGLMPDLSRMSFATSVNNYAPYCLGRMFSENGVPALAYHNNIGTFYNRVNTHTNMGYEFKAIDFGLDMQVATPTSDLEMMQKTVDDYIGENQFHAYYMTYSGHADYTFEKNAISAQNEALVQDMEGSEGLRAYYACQLELERAMTYLVERLEQAGVADRTVIVLTGDHSPYGLSEEDYRTLAGDAVQTDPFWQYRNCFICWNGGMQTPVTVSDYCCTQDILPTLLNLFGFSYDSRLLTGRDVLSDCTHAAILKDGSFMTDRLRYDGATGEITWQDGRQAGLDDPDGYAQQLVAAVQNQFSVAAEILRTDYYGVALPALGLVEGEIVHPDYASYADISGTWYEDAVERLTAQGALTGGGTGAFQGDQAASRADLTAMLARSLQLEDNGEAPPYTDLPSDKWFYAPVAAAWQNGLLPDDGQTAFRPTDLVTKDEAQRLLAAAAAFAGVSDSDAFAAQTVQDALQHQQDAGVSDQSGVSRGAAAWMVATLLDTVENAG